MPDDRPVDDPALAIADLQKQLDDFRSTMVLRMGRRPTGDIEPCIRTSPKEHTLILDGSAVSRTQYPDLWQWANDNGLVVLNGFDIGDGSTTFGLPDFRGRYVMAALSGTLNVLGYIGATQITLGAANIPGHSHTLGASGTHGHGGSSGSVGDHGGHEGGTAPVPPGNTGLQDVWYGGSSGGGGHSHSLSISSGGDHNHGGATGSTGSASPFFNYPLSVGVNWLVWI